MRAPIAPRQRDAAPERGLQRANDDEVARRAVGRVAGALGLGALDLAHDGARQARQLQVLEEDVEELLAREAEYELVDAVAAARARAAAAARAALGPAQLVALRELAVARRDDLAIAARAVPESRLANVLAGIDDVAARSPCP